MIYLDKKLPSAVKLKDRGFRVAFGTDTKACKVLILNLMTTVEQTEEDLLEKLALSDTDTYVTFLHTESRTYKRVPSGHYAKYYRTFSEIKDMFFDGLIVTGSPVFPSPDNAFWEEYRTIDLWAQTHVKSRFHICWGAFASVMQRYAAETVWYDEKYFGVFPTKIDYPSEPLFNSLEDGFLSYASREIGFDIGYIRKQEENGLIILAEYDGKGPAIMRERDSAAFYSLCHFDYNGYTLQNEYLRDINRGIDMHIPDNYYRNDNINEGIKKSVLSNSFFIFDNWLRFYVSGI